MNKPLSIEDFLVIVTGLGFTYRGLCQCNGYHTNKYKKEEYLLYIRTRKAKASLKKHGITVKAYIPISEMLTYINEEIFKEEKAA